MIFFVDVKARISVNNKVFEVLMIHFCLRLGYF
jgi:hypothetical protein